jgi:hypothetical protein
MPLPKDAMGCLTNVSLGEGLNRRYHQHSSFPSLMAHVETRCVVTNEAVSRRPRRLDKRLRRLEDCLARPKETEGMWLRWEDLLAARARVNVSRMSRGQRNTLAPVLDLFCTGTITHPAEKRDPESTSRVPDFGKGGTDLEAAPPGAKTKPQVLHLFPHSFTDS